MKGTYVETSGLLAWLFSEPNAKEIADYINDSEETLSSSLTLIEARRSIVRAEMQRSLKSAQVQVLLGILAEKTAGWHFMEISQEVQARASEKFPVEPIRTLDAIHLATILEFAKVYSDLGVITFDDRVRDNLLPLGLKRAALKQSV